MDSDDTQPDTSLSDSSESLDDNSIKSYLSDSHQPKKFRANSKNLSTKSESSTHYDLLSRSRSVSRGEMSNSSSSCSLLAENSNQVQVIQALGKGSMESTIDTTFLNQSPMKSYEKRPTPHSDSLNNHELCLSPKVELGFTSRNQSISPARKLRSNRSSSSSSLTCCNSQNIKRISNPYNLKRSTENLVLNMRTEDLSDVSDLETERIEPGESKALKTEHDAKITGVQDDFDGDKNKINEEYNDENARFQLDVLNKNDLTDIEKSVYADHIIRNSENGHEKPITDLRQKLDKKKSLSRAMEKGGKSIEKFAMEYVTEALDALSRKHDEDALDFEAEEGECLEGSKDEDIFERGHQEGTKRGFVGEVVDPEELEEGEVTDEEDKRPEETEPKPICRFYTRGQCTWGMSCRFLHPGVTDKGNYTMFDMVRPVPLPHGNAGGFMNHVYHDFRSERSTHHRTPIHHHVTYIGTHEQRVLPQMIVQEQSLPLVESAWERGLRTAKEMMRKANKRKEQDMDFEDKKMNLSLAQDDLEKDNYYIRDRASPETTSSYVLRHPVASHYETEIYGPHGKFSRPSHGTYEEDPFGRAQRYRELPPHRMPQYEDDRRVRPAREVIVQRVDTMCRSDEWNDPWMRSKSPQGRIQDMRERIEKRLLRDGRSYTSNSTYSSSTTSRSESSSESSPSASHGGRRRFDSAHSPHKSSPVRRNLKNCLRSPSPKHRRSPSARRTSGNRRHISSSPVSEKRSRSALSSALKRKKISPSSSRKSSCPLGTNRKQRRGSTSSGSASSDSSGSDSESSYSTSSESSSHADTPLKRVKQNDILLPGRKTLKKVEMIRKRSPPSATESKKLAFGATTFTPDGNSSSLINSSSKKITRREELLKQLRAVEDAIARKRSKLN